MGLRRSFIRYWLLYLGLMLAAILAVKGDSWLAHLRAKSSALGEAANIASLLTPGISRAECRKLAARHGFEVNRSTPIQDFLVRVVPGRSWRHRASYYALIVLTFDETRMLLELKTFVMER